MINTTLPQLKMAASCATCKFSSMNTDRYSKNKIQGSCVAFVPNNTIPSYPYMQGGSFYYPTSLVEALINGKDKYNRPVSVPTISGYVNDALHYLDQSGRPYNRQDAIDYFDAYFRRAEDYATWVKTHGQNIRYIHKDAVCSSWDEAPSATIKNPLKGIISRNGARAK